MDVLWKMYPPQLPVIKGDQMTKTLKQLCNEKGEVYWRERCEIAEGELAAMKVTCEDYRIQACQPDNCRVAERAKAQVEDYHKRNVDICQVTREALEYRSEQQAIKDMQFAAMKAELEAFVRLLDPDGNVVSAMVRLRELLLKPEAT